MTKERYEEIKKILKDNKISSKELDEYRDTCLVKYAEHKSEFTLKEPKFGDMVTLLAAHRTNFKNEQLGLLEEGIKIAKEEELTLAAGLASTYIED